MSSKTCHLKRTTNFSNEDSFKLGALQTLQIIMASMINGEPQCYRSSYEGAIKSESSSRIIPGDDYSYNVSQKALEFKKYFILNELYEDYYSSNVGAFIKKIINDALNENFEETVGFIHTLRNEYMLRLNPQIVLIEVLFHKERSNFNKENPSVMKKIIQSAGALPTDWCKQFELMKNYNFVPPTLWKRAIAEKIQKMSRHHAIKYINGGKTNKKLNIFDKKKSIASLVDLIRITHPKGPSGSIVEEIVRTGKVSEIEDSITGNPSESNESWESLRSNGKSWRYIIKNKKISHIVLLDKLESILREYSQHKIRSNHDLSDEISSIGSQLALNVEEARLFPFKYYSVYKSIHENPFEKSKTVIDSNYLCIIDKFIEICLHKSLRTMLPELIGRVDSLADNSISAHNTYISEYGPVSAAEISNLSAILSVMRATDGGSVWIFQENPKEIKQFRINHTKSVLDQLNKINKAGKIHRSMCKVSDKATSIRVFWEKMIKEKRRLDNVFIYSDQQIVYKNLYAESDKIDFNTLDLVDKYRKVTKFNTNLFSIKIAGHNNLVIPDILYRGAILSGWTGREIKMACEMTKIWNSIENHEL